MAARILIISQGLLEQADGIRLHPALEPIRSRLERRMRRWYLARPRNPLAWYAEIVRCAPASVLWHAMRQQGWAQVWVASPYHAMLGRDTLRVMPEASLPWTEADARWLSELLNPLLEPEGMRLFHSRSAMVLACKQPMQATPLPFAAVAGGLLPNRHPDGADGGRLMRLVAEIQMLLHRHPAEHRRRLGQPDVHGLWFWGAAAADAAPARMPAVATCNPYLRSAIDARDACWLLAEPDTLDALLPRGGRLPTHVVLAGGSHAVWLQGGWGFWRRPAWRPMRPRPEACLLGMLREWVA